MHGFLASVQYNGRLLMKSPGSSITAVLILGFGIGANTAIFSLINAVLLKPLPYSHPERLVKVVLPYQNASADAFDYPDYLDVAAAQTSFDGIALIHGDFLDLTGSGETQRLFVNFVSASLFTFTGRPAILGRTFNNSEDIPHQVLTAELILTSSTYEADGVKTRAFWDAVLAKVRQLPGVSEVAMNDRVPLYYDWEDPWRFTVDGQPDPGVGHRPVLNWHMISTNYFRTLEIPLLQGRDFNQEDRLESRPVVIIDAAMADRYFPDENPIGKVIKVEAESSEFGPRHWTIIGVVSHVRYRSPGTQESQFQAYFPYSQWDFDAEILLLRCQGDPNAQIAAVRKAVQSVDPDVPVPNIRTFDDLIAQKLMTRKLASTLVSLFSGAAPCLSAIGLYGVLAYSVNQRRREIGVRIALGAESSKILQLVTQQGFKLVGVGLMIGIVVALVCARFIEGMLYGVTAADPISLLIAVTVLCLVGCVACLLPALRAIRINPVPALRE